MEKCRLEEIFLHVYLERPVRQIDIDVNAFVRCLLFHYRNYVLNHPADVPEFEQTFLGLEDTLEITDNGFEFLAFVDHLPDILSTFG